MKKLMFAAAVAALTFGVFADDAADLAKTAAEPAVQEEFAEPDGAAIKLFDDGTFQILARGTGTYDFDDVDDVNDAKKEAVLKAKAALAKFMNEKLNTTESLEEAAKKTKTQTSDGENTTTATTKESVKNTATTIKNQADALLKGVITIKMQKIPRKGTTGEIQATVGVSSKTLKAVGKLTTAIDATPSQGQKPPRPAGGSANGSQQNGWTQEVNSDF